MSGKTYCIRYRERFQASPPAGLRQNWIEYQVLHGSKILRRCGAAAEADRCLKNLLAGRDIDDNGTKP
jgi:hypothetical protein